MSHMSKHNNSHDDVTSDESKPSVDSVAPFVELRSDVPSGGGPARPAGGPGKKRQQQWLANSKIVGISAGVILVLLVLGIGVYAGIKQASKPGSGGLVDKGKNIFGALPLPGERDQSISKTMSGLSGRECDNANRRAIGVMLAGDPINRPVSGFAKADLVFELPVLVSDVTRLLAVYQCGRPADIGSVRSARHDYLFLAEGVDAILGHWGGSYHALNRIAVGEFQTINALPNPYNAYFRKSHLPAPYNGFTTYDNLWNALQKLGYRTETKFKGYEFKDDPSPDERGGAGKLTIAWPGAFRVHYEYDPGTNRYQRYWAGVKQVDGEDNSTPVAPSVVAIMRAGNSFADGPGGYNDMDIEGEGDLLLYQDGQEIKGRWRKDERYKNDPVHFMDEAGQEITFTRGQVWIMTVEPHITVTWQPVASAPAIQP